MAHRDVGNHLALVNYDILRALDYFQAVNAASDRRLAEAIDIVRAVPVVSDDNDRPGIPPAMNAAYESGPCDPASRPSCEYRSHTGIANQASSLAGGDVVPRRNRVTPFGELVSTAARGSLMGNRGCLHNRRGEIRGVYQGKRWILCLLDFKNRRRSMMTPGRYTELFFLDEATGFAAGHRPCAECQRERFDLFRETWARANSVLAGAPHPAATLIDDILHQERVSPDGRQRTHLAGIDSLPDGTFVTLDDDPCAYLLHQGALLRWSPFGYARAIRRPASITVRVLTPPSAVRMLTAGFRAGIHPSAARVCLWP